MKNFYLLIVALFSFLASFAIDNKVKIDSGAWNSAATWSLGHVPANGETVVVPDGMTLFVNNNVNFSPSNVVIKVFGTIRFAVGKLNLGAASLVEIHDNGDLASNQGNNSDRITIGGSTVYSGSMGTVSGPKLLTLTGTSVLPVKFVSYSVSRSNNGVSIEWSTEEELNSEAYIIERSEDGTDWKAIGEVKAAGNSSVVNAYSFNDRSSINKVAFYRVKQIDINGHFVYTSIKSVPVESLNTSDIKVTNSASNLVVEFSKSLKGNLMVRLISLSGQIMSQQAYSNPAGNVVLSKGAIKGNYIISISNGQDISIAKQVML